MPQLSPNFWFTNFVLMWFLLLLLTTLTLHLTPKLSSPSSALLLPPSADSSPQWTW